MKMIPIYTGSVLRMQVSNKAKNIETEINKHLFGYDAIVKLLECMFTELLSACSYSFFLFFFVIILATLCPFFWHKVVCFQ